MKWTGFIMPGYRKKQRWNRANAMLAVFQFFSGRQLLVLLCLIAFASIPSQADAADVFKIRSAEFQLEEGNLLLNADIQIEFPEYINIAIEQGFSVPIMFAIEIMQQKNYWPDKRVVSLKQRYRVNYQPMLRSYVIQDENNASRLYFDNLNAAIALISRVDSYPLLDINNLAADLSYYARLQYGIDVDVLPIPLKSSSLWDNDWDLRSKWYDWEIIR